MPFSAAYRAARSASRPATAAAVPPAARSAGRNAFRAIPAVPRIPQRTRPVRAMSRLPSLSPASGMGCGAYRIPTVSRVRIGPPRSLEAVSRNGARRAMAALFSGVGVALVTVFTADGEVDPAGTGKLAADLAGRGVAPSWSAAAPARRPPCPPPSGPR